MKWRGWDEFGGWYEEEDEPEERRSPAVVGALVACVVVGVAVLWIIRLVKS